MPPILARGPIQARLLRQAAVDWLGPEIADSLFGPLPQQPTGETLPTQLPSIRPATPPPPPSWGRVKGKAALSAVTQPYRETGGRLLAAGDTPVRAVGEAIQTGDVAGAPVRAAVKAAAPGLAGPPPLPSEALRGRGVALGSLVPEIVPSGLREGVAGLAADMAADPLNLPLGGAGAVGATMAGRGLYSRLDDAVRAWPTTKPQPVNSLLNFLKGRVSEDELAYRLRPILADRPTITKAEVVEALAQRPIQPVVTRRLPSTNLRISTRMEDYLDSPGGDIRGPDSAEEWTALGQALRRAMRHWYDYGDAPRAWELGALADEAARHARTLRRRPPPPTVGTVVDEPKWQRYSLEGGVPGSYTETVQAMPPRPSLSRRPPGAVPTTATKRENGLWEVRDQFGTVLTHIDAHFNDDEADVLEAAFRLTDDWAAVPPGSFTSHAYPEKDILVWTRGQDYKAAVPPAEFLALEQTATQTRARAQQATRDLHFYLAQQGERSVPEIHADPQYQALLAAEHAAERELRTTWTTLTEYGRTPEELAEMRRLEERIQLHHRISTDMSGPASLRRAAQRARDRAEADLEALRNKRPEGDGPLGRLIEEVQSDLHQKGKKEGYFSPEAERASVAARQQASRDLEDAYRAREALVSRYNMDFADAVRYHNEAALNTPGRGLVPPRPDGRPRTAVEEAWMISQDFAAADRRIEEAQAALEAVPTVSGVPDLPYKEPGWQDLGLKREILDAAARPEIEWIGFTGGDAQADRYSLTRVARRIEYDPQSRTLTAYLHGGGTEAVPNVGPDQLEDYVGAQAAKKLLAAPPAPRPQYRVVKTSRTQPMADFGEFNPEWGIWNDVAEQWQGFYFTEEAALQAVPKTPPTPRFLEGADLTIGGEGMRVAYDKRLRGRLEKLLKPFGVPVESTQVGPQGALVWFARLSPETKQQILEKGFPLLALLAMVQDEDASAEGLGAAGLGALAVGAVAGRPPKPQAGRLTRARSRGFEASITPPKKTITAYKLFRTRKDRPGELFPLFVGANTPVPQGEWVQATSGPRTPSGKVKSKLGDLAYRPGWHAGDAPVATHIGGKSPGAAKPDYRPDDQVWAEVELPDDVDWQSRANAAGQGPDGRLVPSRAQITDRVPYGGHYRYKTNPNMTGDWLISGDMRVKRILTDDEVTAINAARGLADLPRRPRGTAATRTGPPPAPRSQTPPRR